jgi:hypothetical protein
MQIIKLLFCGFEPPDRINAVKYGQRHFKSKNAPRKCGQGGHVGNSDNRLLWNAPLSKGGNSGKDSGDDSNRKRKRGNKKRVCPLRVEKECEIKNGEVV